MVSGGSQPGDGFGGEADFLVLGEAGGGAMVGLVDADDGNETGALENAVRIEVPAADEEFIGVRIAPDVQEAGG